MRADEIEIGRIAADVPLEREVDRVVAPTDPESLLEVRDAEMSAAGRLLEDLQEVGALRRLERGP